jgi:hypothetical protein
MNYILIFKNDVHKKDHPSTFMKMIKSLLLTMRDTKSHSQESFWINIWTAVQTTYLTLFLG